MDVDVKLLRRCLLGLQNHVAGSFTMAAQFSRQSSNDQCLGIPSRFSTGERCHAGISRSCLLVLDQFDVSVLLLDIVQSLAGFHQTVALRNLLLKA